MLGFVSDDIPWNAASNLDLRRSNKSLRSDLVLPSATTGSTTCRREYSLTIDAIMKELSSRNKVCLPLDRWTSRQKLAITLVIAYYTNGNWALREVQLVFDEVDHLFL